MIGPMYSRFLLRKSKRPLPYSFYGEYQGLLRNTAALFLGHIVTSPGLSKIEKIKIILRISIAHDIVKVIINVPG